MTKNDFKIVLAKKAIDSIIKYTLRPDLAKKRRRKEFSESTKNRVLKRQGNLCAICKMPLEVAEFDHANGNPYDNHHLNCQALCPNCHAKLTRKRSKIRHYKRRLGR